MQRLLTATPIERSEDSKKDAKESKHHVIDLDLDNDSLEEGPQDKERSLWIKVQALALKNDDDSFKELSKYVLEAQRTNFDIPLVRQFKAPHEGDGSWMVVDTPKGLTVEPASSDSSSTNGVPNGKMVNGNGKSNGYVYVGSEKPIKDGDLFLLEIVSRLGPKNTTVC